MAVHNDFGKEGEEDAVNFLLGEGHTILERNFRFGHAEIDVITLKDEVVHIVEVKTRTSSAYGEPESFVNKQKVELLVKAANFYVEKMDLDREVQFDIVSIVKNNVEFTINYIEDAFYPF
ncbi:YraN family protein [Capnocytophaga sp. oral taxon 878]|uniref:YraN family protein n=1 Tax=Capnocytophaga sp. oral taxon 878 TaxID=1316596 RepID=UPI000D047F81|nr:YraN family protein [Capnocytophaga sp. oral taxon 878]AVM49749.1 endonuclease [Capnocytophaga sp. oral taxon 878]